MVTLGDKHPAKEINWMDAQCYVIDIFLWFMARRGYVLQKSRAKVDFSDIEEDISKTEEERKAYFSAALTQDSKKPKLPEISVEQSDQTSSKDIIRALKEQNKQLHFDNLVCTEALLKAENSIRSVISNSYSGLSSKGKNAINSALNHLGAANESIPKHLISEIYYADRDGRSVRDVFQENSSLKFRIEMLEKEAKNAK